LKLEKPVSFDSRSFFWKEDIYTYLMAQAEHEKPCEFLWIYTVDTIGMSENEAAMRLKNLKANEIHELFQIRHKPC